MTAERPASIRDFFAKIPEMDARARKILFDTYWSSSGWRPDPQVRADDLEYAKAHGAMFDPVTLSHDEAVRQACGFASQLDERRVADAFLASLSTRKVEWRSGLGSFSVLHRMPIHASAGAAHCRVCGMLSKTLDHDLSVLNFERVKWGGVRHKDPVYAALDMRLLMQAPPPPPTDSDLRIFRDLVTAIRAVAPSVTSAELHRYFPPTLKSNKSERDVIVAILGFCGVLESPLHPGFGERFVAASDRSLPDRRFVDMPYPACWWKGAYGLNLDRLTHLFGHAL